MFASGWKMRFTVATVTIIGVFSVITALDLLTGRHLIETSTGQGTTDETTSISLDSQRALQAFGSTTLPEFAAVDLTGFGSAKGLGQGISTTAPESPSRDTTFDSMRNNQEKFSRFADVQSDQLKIGDLTEPATKNDNGGSPEGQFRLACEYSHFSYDDPIIYPGQPGKSHFHMFFGNTNTDAFTTDEKLINEGGATCQGFELNRSAYWVPALLDGKGNAVVPFNIIIYYKTKDTGSVIPMPQGLQMIGGNDIHNSFKSDNTLHWSCGGSGKKYKMTNRIPNCNGDVINASIQFPNCWDGVNLSKPAPDYTSHLTYVSESSSCPSSHPQRLPQISFLIYWEGTDSVDGWHLSSDNLDAPDGVPGGSLHADWWGGWNDETIALWTNNCLRASRNCSFGQTGTSRELASLNKLEKYEGPRYIPIPS